MGGPVLILTRVNPLTHLMAGWLVAESAPVLTPRERALVAWAGVIPDLDGLGMPVEMLTRNSRDPLLWFTEYHHTLGHNLGFALFCTTMAFVLAKRRALTALLTAVSFHLHLLGDLIGARGPDGEKWPIPYGLPFTNRWQWVWAGQWPLNGWQNIVITVAAMALIFHLARRRGYSPVGLFSRRADGVFIATLRRRFPLPR